VLEAIRLNGVEVDMNLAAFEWGRRAAFDLRGAESAAGFTAVKEEKSLSDLVEKRVQFLTAYQNATYAARYRARIARIAAAEERLSPGSAELATEVAHSLFKLMAIKDEYEVARLYTDGSFEKQLSAQFGGWDSLEFHLAPPLLAKRDKRTGHLKKQSFGPWMMRAFRILSRLRFLRGTFLDPFGRLAERRWERRLLAEYESDLDLIEANLSAAILGPALALAAYPRKIRGFGHVKQAQARGALGAREKLLRAFAESETAPMAEAAE
jgi:indolepyruvate ferredoxin oxidoreductase